MSVTKKPAEYKEYVNFLQNYAKNDNNLKKEDSSCTDSGVNSPLTGSSASLNSDTTEISLSDADGTNTTRVKTEICIEINKPTVTDYVKKANKDCIIKTTHVQRRGSVKNMSRMFEVENRSNTIKKNVVKCPLPIGKTSLEKLLEKDNNNLSNKDSAVKTCNNINSIKRDLSGKPSLEKLLKEDEQNSKQDLKKTQEIIKPLTNLEELIKENHKETEIKQETLNESQNTLEKLLFNDQQDQITLNTENIFTTIKKEDTTDSKLIKNTLERLLSNETTLKEEKITTKPAIPEKPILPTSPTSPKPTCPTTPPPPPPPMPTVLPKFKNDTAQTVKVTTLPKPPVKVELDEEKLRKKLAYGQMMNICNSYNDKANDYVATLPKAMVHQNKNIQNIIQSIALNGGLEKLCGRTNPKVE